MPAPAPRSRASTNAPRSEAGADMPKVIIWREGAIETEFDPGHRDWRIGRSETNDITLLDPRKSVSRFHAELREENGRWVFIDLNSQNGSWNAEGQRINRLVLEHGHEVLFGDYKLAFDDPPPVAAPPPVPPPMAATAEASLQTAPVIAPDQTLLMPGVKGAPTPATPAAPPPVVRPASKPKAAPRKGVNPVILVLFLLTMFGALGAVAWRILTSSQETVAENRPADTPAESPAPTDAAPPEAPATAATASSTVASDATTPATSTPDPATSAATAGPGTPGVNVSAPGTGATSVPVAPGTVAVPPATASTTTVPPPTAPGTPATPRPGTVAPGTTAPGGRPKRTPAAPKESASLAARYEEGRRAFENGRYAEAERALEAVIAQNPNFRDASALLQRARNMQVAARERALADAQAAEAGGDWTRAISLYERAGASDEAGAARTKMHAAGEDAYRKARQFDARNRPTEAMNFYQQAVSWLPDGDARKATAQERLAALKGGGA